MHISIVNILIDRTHIALPNNMKSYMAFRSAYIHLTLTHSKGQIEGHAHFDLEYRHEICCRM